jgi:hypothetical protein
MTKTLTEYFRENPGQPVQIDGVVMRGIYKKEIEAERTVRVRFVGATAERPQAISLQLEKGKLRVNDQELKSVILWNTTAPTEVMVELLPNGKQATFKVWNSWKDERGTTHAWIGNAGMTINETADKAILKCSDGVGPIDVNDLVVELEWI